MNIPGVSQTSFDLSRANQAILELNKAFRSRDAGDQIKAILQMPELISKMPTPLVVNSVFLKVADLFILANNTVRSYVVNVCSKFTLNDFASKMINKADFLQKIESVMHCNDAVARSLTLRLLTVFSGISRNRVSCHHFVRNALDSNDSTEMEAALFATIEFARSSSMFSAMIMNKIQSLLSSLSCPPEHVMALITAIGYCGHNLELTRQVVDVLLQYCNTFNSTVHLRHIFTILTRASIKNRVMCDEVIQHLLDELYLETGRIQIQLTSLNQLLLCAHKVGHSWTHSQSDHLMKFAIQEQNNVALFKNSINVIEVLPIDLVLEERSSNGMDESKRTGVQESLKSKELMTQLMEICETYCFTKQGDGVVESLRLYLKYAQFDDFIPTFEYVLSQLEVSSSGNESQLMRCLGVLDGIFSLPLPPRPLSVFGQLCLVLLTQFITNVNTLPENTVLKQPSVDCLKSFLTWTKCFADKCSTIVDKSASERRKIGVSWKNLRSTIWDKFEKLAVHKMPSSLLSTLVSVRFSICSKEEFKGDSDALREENWLDLVLLSCPNKWVLYKIVRNLMRYGQFSVARYLLSSLIEDCQQSKTLSWFKILALICKCESNVLDEKQRNFQQILIDYHACVRIIEAQPRLNRSNAEFQKKFTSLRFQFLHVCNQILDVVFWAKTFQPIPEATESKGGKHSIESVSDLVEKCVELWELLNAVVYAYSCLQTSCVDIDENSSVLSVRNLQLHCRLLAMALHSLFLAPFQHLHPLLIPPSSIKVPEMHELDEKHLLEAQITRIIAKFDGNAGGSSKNLLIKLEAMKDCVELVLTKGEFAIPKFFFHCSCTTTVKLITSPSQSQLHSHNITPSGGCGSLGSDPLVVFAGENLTLRTEGVVTQTRKRKERRPDSKLSVNKCYVHYSLICTHPISGAEKLLNEKFANLHSSNTLKLSDVTTVDSRGYFSSLVLIKPFCSGTFQLNISLKLAKVNSDVQWGISDPNCSAKLALKAINKSQK